jgi:CheY-like chemotaxis protein
MERRPTRVLIVDDDTAMAQAMVRMLRRSKGFDVRVAQSAASALETAAGFVPDITFLDIDLPDMSGYELARLMHQHPDLQQMRLIALTESGEHRGREQARTSGFERYLIKPVTPAALREALQPSR